MPASPGIETAAQLKAEHSRFAYSFLPGTLFVLLLWLIFFLAYITDASLVRLGVLPKHFFGLIGVFTSPLIHSDLVHLLSNSFPLILLTGIILFLHRRVAVPVFTFVYIGSGLLTWFIGRQAYHVGASGVIYGMAGFLLFQGLLRRDRASLAVSLAVLFLYAGLFHGLFPGEERVSWEGHIGGFLAGLAAAMLYGENLQQEKVEEETEEAQAIRRLQQKHLSSTLQPARPQLPLVYTIATTPANQVFSYRYHLNKRTGMVEALTPEADPSSIKPASIKKSYGRELP